MAVEQTTVTGPAYWASALINGNGVWRGSEGPCHSCRGTGRQSYSDMRRNVVYNRFKLRNISL